jgi:hypothetical protein
MYAIIAMIGIPLNASVCWVTIKNRLEILFGRNNEKNFIIKNILLLIDKQESGLHLFQFMQS